MPESHRRHAQWTLSRIISWADKTGPAAAALVKEILARRPHPEQGYRSALGIIRLGDRYGGDRVWPHVPERYTCGPSPTSPSSRSSSTRSTANHFPMINHPSPPHPTHRNVRGARYYQ
jgi:hypothetical protein